MTHATILISQALVKLRPKNAGGSVVKRVPCVERGLDNFRSIRWERERERERRVLLFEVLCLHNRRTFLSGALQGFASSGIALSK